MTLKPTTSLQRCIMCRIIVCTRFMVFAAPSAFAEVVARCGEFKGHTYFPIGPGTSRAKSGWVKDKMSGGSTSITVTKNSQGSLEHDIIFTDATGKNKSLKSQGFLVAQVNGDNLNLHILAIHIATKTTEVYVLDRTLLQLSYVAYKNVPIKLTRAMVSQCE